MINQFDFDHLRNLSIGTVDSVSPMEVKVMLDTDAPQNTALNTGIPSLFPRINGFVLIPNEIGALVGIISWIGVEHSAYPKRKGFKDYDLIDLPFPMRKMTINPVGTLKQKGKIQNKEYELERGVYSFPSIGDNVILPTEHQLRAIVENKDKNAYVKIGKAVIAGNADVSIDPDKLFGRHLAVLGNTGSGKSCTVAGLIRWSLEAAKEKSLENGKPVNARFIILDPNGEYSKSFDGINRPVRKYKVKYEAENNETNTNQLQVPAWMWNSQEWINFSQAAPGAQRPLLLQSLVDLKRGAAINESIKVRINSFLTSRKNLIDSYLHNMPNADISFPRFAGFTDALEKLILDIAHYRDALIVEIEPIVQPALATLYTNIEGIIATRRRPPNAQGRVYYSAFTNTDLEQVSGWLLNIINSLKESTLVTDTISPDTPKEFKISDLTPFLLELAENEGGNTVQFVHMLSLRMRFLLSDERLNSVVVPKEELSLTNWLNEYIGKNDSEGGEISVIDLSLIPSDVVHVVVAVLSRLIFEALQRYRRINQKELPTVIVLEEAHTFIRDTHFDTTNQAQLCRETFERIAREGRKFGLSLVLSSQRPSELSPTVLSQCNTFILHRIVNDRDQELVKKLVPDNIGGLLKELSILPTRKAILLGWATPIPMLVEVRELKKEHRPHSNDPMFWDVWVGNEGGERIINWEDIANDWQGIAKQNSATASADESIPNDNTSTEEDADLPF
jgi:DNA helicase HerA-like ATPase